MTDFQCIPATLAAAQVVQVVQPRQGLHPWLGIFLSVIWPHSLPFRLLDRRLVDMASDEIQVGQRVQQNGAVWEVMEIKHANGLLHVQISKVGDPTELKLISLSSLLGGYDLLPE